MTTTDKKVSIVEEDVQPKRTGSREISRGKRPLRMVTRKPAPGGNDGGGERPRRGSIAKAVTYFESLVQPRTTVGAALIAQRIKHEKKLSLREHAFLVLEEPTSSFLARFFSTIVTLVTLVATTAATLETCKGEGVGLLWRTLGDEPFEIIRVSCSVFFILEAIVRVACYIPLRQAILDPFLWLDCLTPVPFLIQLVTGYSWPIFEAWGTIRLLKLCRFYEGASLLGKALRLSSEQLAVPLFMLTTMVVCFASVLYRMEADPEVLRCMDRWRDVGLPEQFMFLNPDGITWGCEGCSRQGDVDNLAADVAAAETEAEQEELYRCVTCPGYPPGDPACKGVSFSNQFHSIPHAMWFVLVTVSTVGYGDVSPTTTLGQFFTSVVILCGVLFLAMPLAVVGNNFQQVWNDRTLYKMQALMRQMLSENNMSPEDCLTAFKQFDEDGNGLIDEKEFVQFVVGVLGLKLKKPELVKLWGMLDVNRSGTVNFVEFSEMLFPYHTFEEEDENEKSEKSDWGEHTFALKQAAAADNWVAAQRDGINTMDAVQSINAKKEQLSVLALAMASEPRAPSPQPQGTGDSKPPSPSPADVTASKPPSLSPADMTAISDAVSAAITDKIKDIVASEVQRCLAAHTAELGVSVAKLQEIQQEMNSRILARRSRSRAHLAPPEAGYDQSQKDDSSTLTHTRHRSSRTNPERLSPPTTEHPGRQRVTTPLQMHAENGDRRLSKERKVRSSTSSPEIEA